MSQNLWTAAVVIGALRKTSVQFAMKFGILMAKKLLNLQEVNYSKWWPKLA